MQSLAIADGARALSLLGLAGFADRNRDPGGAGLAWRVWTVVVGLGIGIIQRARDHLDRCRFAAKGEENLTASAIPALRSLGLAFGAAAVGLDRQCRRGWAMRPIKANVARALTCGVRRSARWRRQPACSWSFGPSLSWRGRTRPVILALTEPDPSRSPACRGAPPAGCCNRRRKRSSHGADHRSVPAQRLRRTALCRAAADIGRRRKSNGTTKLASADAIARVMQ